MILPGSTLGVLGGGQLGRMFTVAARTMGYAVWVYDPDPASPAAAIADRHICAPFGDTQALMDFGRACAAITTEFENVPADTLRRLGEHCPVRPGADAVAITQDRIAEKRFLRRTGVPVARFFAIESPADVAVAAQCVVMPAILKRSRLGYDGKGQIPIAHESELPGAFAALGSVPCVLEQRLALELEISAIVARDAAGHIAAFPVAENRHRHGILDMSIVPARVAADLAQQASEIAGALAEALQYCGVLTVEFFVVEGGLVVNELAPRPHNSGHYTLDACVTDQFEQQVRALCGLPLGETRLLTPAAMVNVLGDVWAGGMPAWDALLAQPATKLHLYGKNEPRAGRKMGHFTCLAPSADEAVAIAEAHKRRLGIP